MVPDLHATVTQLNAKIPDLNPTVAKANATLNIINHSCSPGPCGTLANVNKLVVKVGDIAVDTQTQVRQSGKLINAASSGLSSVSDHLNTTLSVADNQLTHVGPLLDSARTATDSISPTLGKLGLTIDASTQTIKDADARINDPNIAEIVKQWAAMSTSAAGLMADGKKVTDKATADYLSPKPWWRKLGAYAGDTYDYGALFARHTP